MKNIADRARAACTRCAAFCGKWLLTAFVAVAAFALAAQALALVLAALALLVLALCLASLCMPEESRAVWAWMRETLGRWSAVAGTDTADGDQAPCETPGESPGKMSCKMSGKRADAAQVQNRQPQSGDSGR